MEGEGLPLPPSSTCRFDHIPVSKGGSNTARNLELRCETCNRRKGATIWAVESRALRRSGSHPAPLRVHSDFSPGMG